MLCYLYFDSWKLVRCNNAICTSMSNLRKKSNLNYFNAIIYLLYKYYLCDIIVFSQLLYMQVINLVSVAE
jgi:hypothetical protein